MKNTIKNYIYKFTVFLGLLFISGVIIYKKVLPALDIEKINSSSIRMKIVALILALIISLFSYIIIMKIQKLLNFKPNLNNINEKIVVAALCVFIILPNVVYTILPSEYKKNSENRTLKAKPAFSIETIQTYPKTYEEYYNDNLPFKDYFVRLNSMVKYKVLDMSPANYVIKGKDNWLFYNSKYKNDQDTLADYQGTNKFSEEELKSVTASLLEKKEFLDSEGIELCLFIAPNKSQIYSEYMPDEYHKNSGLSKADELVKYLRANTDINIVYPKKELLALKDDFQLYSKLDTHWTSLGAYIGYTEIMKALGSDFDYKELSQCEIVSTDIKTGDLASMINLNGVLDDKAYSIKNVYNGIDIKLIEDKGKPMNRFSSTNLNGKKLLAYRDSYAINLVPFLSREFEESAFVWGQPFNEEQIREEKPDVVIIEVVERLVKNLYR